MENQQAMPVATRQEKDMEYTALGSSEKVKLSVGIVRRYIAQKTRSGAEASDEDVMKFMMLCKVRGLNPWENDAYLQGYDSKDGPKFTLITAHQAFLKRAEFNPQFDGMESGVVVEDQHGDLQEYQGDLVLEGHKLIGGWARVYLKNRKIPVYRRLKLSTFDTGQSRWAKDPAGMIVKCSEGDALRSAFPLSLGGLYMQEEQGHVVDVSEVRPEAKRGKSTTISLPKSTVVVSEPEPPKTYPPEYPQEPPPTSSGTSINEAFTQSMLNAGVDLTSLIDVCELKPNLKANTAAWLNFSDVSDADAAFIVEHLDVSTPGELKWKTKRAK